MEGQPRAFLDTNVLLGYYRGDREIARLFDRSILEKTRYSINPIVIQELVLGLDKSRKGRVDLDELSRMVDIVSEDEMIDETNQPPDLEFLRPADSKLHVNDYLNVSAALRNRCEFFITDDRKLLTLRHNLPLRFVTPDAFLHMETVA